VLTGLQLKKFCWFALTACWSFAALAAQNTLPADLRSIPVEAIAIAVVLAVIGGAAHTAAKLADATTVLKSVRLEVLKDVLSSVVAGLITFFVCSYLGWASVLQAACITLAGYGGSRVLEKYLDTALTRIIKIGDVADKP
jgi:hypothetical protein